MQEVLTAHTNAGWFEGSEECRVVVRLKYAEVLKGLEEYKIDGGLKKCRNIGGLSIKV